MTINFDLRMVKSNYPKLKSDKKNFIRLEKNINKTLKKKNLKKNKFFKFKEFGKIIFPYYSMGKIKSYHLFCANEFIIFYLYLKFKEKYKYGLVCDLGSNLGLHSIILEKIGYKVTAYEPDPVTFKKLKNNIKINKCKNVILVNKAIYNKTGSMKFTRVNDNLTGSHLGKLKKSYGKREYLNVKTVNIKKIISQYELIKIDIESAEAAVLCSLSKSDYINSDFIVEVGNKNNSKKIYNYLKKRKLKFYSQKNYFNLVKNFSQMPVCHQDGALVITQKKQI